MSIQAFNGKQYFVYDNKRYVAFSKPFNRLINQLRQQDKKPFDTITIYGNTYAPNPVLTGKGSRDPLVELETKINGKLSKRGKKKQDTINELWEDKVSFVRKGIKYAVTHQVRYDVNLLQRNGSIYTNTYEATLSNASFTPRQNMNRREVEKHMIEEELMKRYTALSPPENVETISIEAQPVGEANLRKVKMNGVKYLYNYEGIDNNIETAPGSCVKDYILYEFSKPNTKLQSVLRTDIPDVHTTEEVIDYAQRFKSVSVYALDPLFRVFAKHIATDVSRCCLMFVVNNNHCYPITDPTMRKRITTAGHLELQKIKVDFDSAKFAQYAYYKHKDGERELIDESKHQVENSIDISNIESDIILPMESLECVARDFMTTYKTLITNFTYYDGNLVAFQHPTSGFAIVAGRDYQARKAICDDYFAKHKVCDFKFKNQEWGAIGRSILESFYVSLPRSEYSTDAVSIFEQYPIRPYRMSRDYRVKGDEVSIDQHRCYSSILMNYKHPWIVTGAFDAITTYQYADTSNLVPGFYFINKDFYMGNGTILVSKNFWDHAFVEHALLKGYITGADITYVMYADRQLPGNTFSQFAKDVYEQYPDDSKAIINMVIGSFGSLYHKTTEGAATCDFKTAVGTIIENPSAVLHQFDLGTDKELYIIQDTKRFTKSRGEVPIYRQIIAASIVALDNMVTALQPEEIVAYNTDSIKLRGGYNHSVVKNKKDCTPGEYHLESTVCLAGKTLDELEGETHLEYVLEHKPIVEVEEKDMDTRKLLDEGGLVLGMPGCGKSYLIKTLWHSLSTEVQTETVVLGYTNAAVENLKERGVPAETLSSLLWDEAVKELRKNALAKYRRVILDEFSMLPPYEMGLLMAAKKEYGLVVICVGDPDQCKAPVSNWVDYPSNRLFLEMCNNYIIHTQYKREAGYARFNEELYTAIRKFKDTLQLDWQCSKVDSYDNICYTNKKRNEINKECLSRWVKEHQSEVVKFGFDLCVGMPVMAYNDADKKLEVFKTQVWTVVKVEDKLITLERQGRHLTFTRVNFRKIFDYKFCYTVHKCQGVTVQGHYNIFEAEAMTADILYTAISRGTKKELVHIVGKKSKYSQPIRPLSISIQPQLKALVYGRIYEITLEDGSKYIGKTNKTIEERLAEHLEKPTNDKMLATLNDKATIRLLDEFLYTSEKVFAAIEEEYIKSAKKTEELNNKQHNTTKTTVKKVAVAKKSNDEKLRIGEDVGKKRYEVRLGRKNVASEHKVKRFSYSSSSKEEAYAEAKAWRDELVRMYL